MSFTSALPAQKPLFGFLYVLKRSSDSGFGKDIVLAIKEYLEACGLPVPLVRDGYLIEPEDHNLQVSAYLAIKDMLRRLGLV